MSDTSDGNTEKWGPERLLRMLIDCIVFNQPLRNIQTILRAGVDPNGSLKQGLRPLHYAAFHNRPDVIYLMTHYGGDVNRGDDVGYTPLHIAAKHGYMECAISLLDNGAVVNFHDKDGMQKAEEDSRVLALLTVHPLNLAIENNHPLMTELLLQRGANPNQKYFIGHEINVVPLENVACLEVLLRFGADPNSYNRSGITPLMKACKQSAIEAAKTLITYGADVNITCDPKIDQKRALHYAVMRADLEMIKLLLDAGAETRKPEEFPFPPLEFAVSHDKLDVCNLLLKYGADPNEINGELCTPLQIACTGEEIRNIKDIVHALLENGADPNFCSEKFSYIYPCLSSLVEYLKTFSTYDKELIKLLFQFGAEVNLTRATGRYKIKDEKGIVSCLRKFSEDDETLHVLLDVCIIKNKEEIRVEGSIPPLVRAIALEAASEPACLKHQCRVAIRKLLTLPKPRHIELLELPTYIKEYLLFNTR